MDRIKRKEPQGMAELMKLYVREMGMTHTFNNRRVFIAWDQASNAARYTVNRFFRDGILSITLNSSVVRTELAFRKGEIIKAMNDILVNDSLFIKDAPGVKLVHDIILK